MVEYKTKFVTLVIFGNDRFQVEGDGLMPSGEYDHQQVDAAFNQLENEGWRMVGSVDRKPCDRPFKAIDVFFRREHDIPD